MLLHLLAQAAVAAAPQAAAPAQGVISYPAAFFANYQPANANEMVARVPGFSLDTGSGSRGYEGSAGNVLIDGQRPASKTDSLDEILKRMPASSVERIDVIRGGAPGIDMQGKSVLANVVRKKGAAGRLLFAVAQNHTWDGRTALAGRIEGSGALPGDRKWEFGSFFGKGIDDGSADGPAIIIYADGRPPQVQNMKQEGDGNTGFVTGAFETPLAGGKLKVNGRLYWDKFKYDEDDEIRSPVPGLLTDDWTQWTHDTEIGGNYSRPFGSKATLDLVALRQTRDRTFDETFASADEVDDFALDRQSSETIGRAVLKYKLNEKTSLEGGAETALNKLDSATSFLVDGAAVDLPAANVEVEEVRSEVFLKGAWRPSAQWTLDGALRYESSTISSEGDVVLEKTLHYAKPRVAVTWAPSDKRQFRFRIEREVGQLNFNDFVASASLTTSTGVTAGNPDLDPEQAWVAEAAFEQRFWDSGALVLTARHYKISDVIDRGPVFTDTGDVFDTPQNIGDGTKDELSAELTLPLDKLGWKGAQLRGDVTKRWSEVRDPTTGEDREISGLHPIDFNIHFVHDIPSRRLSWGVDLFGAWRETYYRFDSIDDHKLHSFMIVFAEWRPQPDLSIRAEVDNATSRDWRQTIRTFPGPRSQPGAPDIQARNTRPGPMFYVRVRKTFGG
jgi:outer membrane receptor protein involved in Fe transport